MKRVTQIVGFPIRLTMASTVFLMLFIIGITLDSDAIIGGFPEVWAWVTGTR